MPNQKSGFTLLELLVIIGILAVLAVIAVPTIVGLIDKANVSADTKEADEIMNAMERFASEYELYKQDIAMSSLDLSNLNSSQSRVYNSVKTASMRELQLLESVGFNGNIIDKDTKYPITSSLINAVINNYTDRDTTYVAPRQQNYHYYFSPDIGITVFADVSKSSTQELNELVLSGKDAHGNSLDEHTRWVDITQTSENVIDHNGNVVPKGAIYEAANGIIYGEGMKLPAVKMWDIYYFGEYSYVYSPTGFGIELNGWSVFVNSEHKDKETYESPLAYIAGEPVVKARQIFRNNKYLKYAPKMPDTIIDMSQAFQGCIALEYCPDIPNSVVYLSQTFAECVALKTPPKISANVENMQICFGQSGITTMPDLRHCSKLTTLASTFFNCHNIVDASGFYIPESVTDCGSLFNGSQNIKTAPRIPSTVRKITNIFKNCPALEGTVYIDTLAPDGYSAALLYTKVSGVQGNIPDELKEAILATK